MEFVWDTVSTYRLNQAGLKRYLETIFTAESHKRYIKREVSQILRTGLVLIS